MRAITYTSYIVASVFAFLVLGLGNTADASYENSYGNQYHHNYQSSGAYEHSYGGYMPSGVNFVPEFDHDPAPRYQPTPPIVMENYEYKTVKYKVPERFWNPYWWYYNQPQQTSYQPSFTSYQPYPYFYTPPTPQSQYYPYHPYSMGQYGMPQQYQYQYPSYYGGGYYGKQ